VLLDGLVVRSYLMFAVRADGRDVRTVVSLADGEELHPLQAAFHEHHGLQCGFCTPGFLMALAELWPRRGDVAREEIEDTSPPTSAGAPTTRASWRPPEATFQAA
jgi:carbon-monoxide dehydrogenase small subunit